MTREAAVADRKTLLARLHCLKKEQGWSDDEYRDILQARTGQRSAAALTDQQLGRTIAALGVSKRKGAYLRPTEWAFIDAAIAERRPLLRKICAVCRAMGVGKAYAEGVARRQHGIDRHLEMMDANELWKVAAALSRTQAHRDRAAPPPEGGV